MIRIDKPAKPPAVLLEKGITATATLCRCVEDEDDRGLVFDKDVYGGPSVKQALKDAQHDKCCFCESKISHVAFGDVEHFRPKAACRASPETPERRPGYYWLAYEWSNLYFACEQCNRRHKRNLFPLEDESARVLSHRDAERLTDERPLYLDPGREDPEAMIGFRREVAKEKHGSIRGKATIGSLSLNRPSLCDRRSERRNLLLTLLRNVRNWLSRLCPEPERADVERNLDVVLSSIRNDAEYAAMSRALVREVIPWRELSPSMKPAELLEQLEDDALAGRWLAIPPR